MPPRWVLDEAAQCELRLFVDVPWDKHRAFFEDWPARREAVARVRETARGLGDHPALFAISVANEIPHDIVRFYGTRRVERFVNELVAVARDEAPDCPVTYTNYPSTEFLTPSDISFYCANVYLNEPAALARYLDRLQHVAGNLPLVLGEHGSDSLRGSLAGQAAALRSQLTQVFRHGCAGSFVFSFTDDWYTGGSQITDWAFGVTDAGRCEKPAAAAVHDAWSAALPADRSELPRVSVVVCSYNGAATLEECLRSLVALEYPDFEIILVDDGSTDDTPQIASRFPTVRTIRQPNLGLGAARNAGLSAATGKIIAYTDSDCVAEPSWLTYLVLAMREQDVEAVGGPNVPPPRDNWVAKCVAASPGGPSHVMLDDRHAEHVPGCNMAFDRDRLAALGGFDLRFRQAGDDVDVCWRWMDAGLKIGYAASAFVWHHRRSTVRAYLRQQEGYGRSEAMVYLKHPRRFNALGHSRWKGVIYGEGAVGLSVAEPIVYHGRFGNGPFQIIYRDTRYTAWAYFGMIEWHAVAAALALLAAAAGTTGMFFVPGAMWSLALLAALRSSATAPLPSGAPIWCRPLVFLLHLVQPVVRGWHRYGYRLSIKRVPQQTLERGLATGSLRTHVKRIAMGTYDLYWRSDHGRGRDELLEALTRRAADDGWTGDLHAEWGPHDIEFWADAWHNVRMRAATEELGGGKRFTRLRWTVSRTRLSWIATGLAVLLAVTCAWGRHWDAALVAGGVVAFLLGLITGSHTRCRDAVAALACTAGADAGLEPVATRAARASAADVAKKNVNRDAKLPHVAEGEVSDTDLDFGEVAAPSGA